MKVTQIQKFISLEMSQVPLYNTQDTSACVYVMESYSCFRAGPRFQLLACILNYWSTINTNASIISISAMNWPVSNLVRYIKFSHVLPTTATENLSKIPYHYIQRYEITKRLVTHKQPVY